MLFNAVEFLRLVHGHVGLLAVVLLLHPAITLGRVRPGAPVRAGLAWSAALAVALTLVTFVAGWLLYPGYRRGTKKVLLEHAPAAAALFETKEHLAFYAAACALSAGVALLGTRTAPGLRFARVAFGLSAALAAATFVHGLVVYAFTR